MQNKIKGDMQKLSESIQSLQKDMQHTNTKISNAKIAIRDFIVSYFNDLIAQVNGTSLEAFSDVMQREIGSEGSIMIAKMQNTFEKYTHQIISELQTNIARFDAESGDFEKAISGYGKQGIEWLQKSGAINSQNVLMARDLLKSGLETIGINIGTALNFKPWGAVNFAKNANICLAIVGIALEAWDSYKEQQKIEAFKKARNDIIKMLESQMKELLELINNKEQFYALFSGYEPLSNALNDTKNKLNELETKALNFNEWIKEGKLLEAKIIKS